MKSKIVKVFQCDWEFIFYRYCDGLGKQANSQLSLAQTLNVWSIYPPSDGARWANVGEYIMHSVFGW